MHFILFMHSDVSHLLQMLVEWTFSMQFIFGI